MTDPLHPMDDFETPIFLRPSKWTAILMTLLFAAMALLSIWVISVGKVNG